MRTKSFYLLAVCAMMLLINNANAQETKFGIKAGVHGANFSSDIPDFESDMKIGFHIGGSVLLGLSDNFGINADVLYSIKGAKQTVEQTETVGSVSVTLKGDETVSISYLEIPILARYTLESGLYFNAGPYLGLRMGYKSEYDYTMTTTINGVSTSTSESGSSTEDEGITSSDFGLKVGLGYKLESGLDFGLNYGMGFGNVLDSDAGGDDYYIRNSTIGLTIGYWFGE
jgi:hypothetical protein